MNINFNKSSLWEFYEKVNVGAYLKLEFGDNRICKVFNLEMNEWNGNKKPQAMIVDIEIK